MRDKRDAEQLLGISFYTLPKSYITRANFRLVKELFTILDIR